MALSLNDEIARQLYSKVFSPQRQRFEDIPRPAYLLQLLTIQDITELNKICMSKRLSARPKEKFAMINDIMVRRGFKKLAAGTNRIAFKFLEDQSFVVKVAFAKTALSDNFRELQNQQLLKPFVTKVFEVSPCGTVGLFERVNPISNREQFMSIAPDVYDIIINHLLGKYVIDDIGSQYFMNWGVRSGSFPVLLDFPYVFELDGSKLYCNCPDPASKFGFCGGDIDYDDGFNHLVCQKCGKKYLASDLRVNGNNSSTPSIIVDRKGDIDMKVQIIDTDTNKVVSENNTEKETTIYEKTRSGKPQGFGLDRREQRRKPRIKLAIETVEEEVEDENTSETPTVPAAFENPGIKPVIKYKNTIVDSPDTPNRGFADKIVITEEKTMPPEETDVTDYSINPEPPMPEDDGVETEDPVTSQEAWDEMYNRENDLGDATAEDTDEDSNDSDDVEVQVESEVEVDADAEVEALMVLEPEGDAEVETAVDVEESEENEEGNTEEFLSESAKETAAKKAQAKKLVTFVSDDPGDDY